VDWIRVAGSSAPAFVNLGFAGQFSVLLASMELPAGPGFRPISGTAGRIAFCGTRIPHEQL
jgi:hypothetical protein